MIFKREALPAHAPKKLFDFLDKLHGQVKMGICNGNDQDY